MGRRAPPGEARHRQIEAAPEEMHRARLAEKAAAEQLEHPVGLHQRAPEAVRGLGVVRLMRFVQGEADRVRHLVGPVVDPDRNADSVQEAHDPAVERRDALRLQRQRRRIPAAGAHQKAVRDEVELDLEDLVPAGMGEVPSPAPSRRAAPASRD
jgi:hypothetical protein